MGRHRRNQLCNRCGKAEGEPIGYGTDPGEPVTLLIDLDRYTDEDRIFSDTRSPGYPPADFQVWCVGCARTMVEAGDPITNFREPGHPDNSPEGPYARFLAGYGAGIRIPRPPEMER